MKSHFNFNLFNFLAAKINRRFGNNLPLKTFCWNVKKKLNTANAVRPWDARFFGEEKTRAAQNSCNFCNLIGWKQDDQKTVLLKALLHKFLHLKLFLTQFKNVHLRGPYSLRPCISRPYCILNCEDTCFLATKKSKDLYSPFILKKQYLHDLCLTQKSGTFTKPFSCVKVERFAESTALPSKDFANTVLKMNGV